MERSRRMGIHRYSEGESKVSFDFLASETLVHLYSSNRKIASLLATPTDLTELYIGHTLCEGYGYFPDAVVACIENETGSLKITIDQELTVLEPNRGVVTSSCGACNVDGLDELIGNLPGFNSKHKAVLHEDYFEALESMRNLQSGFRETGGMHAAALWHPSHGLRHVSEDIGRHNATDKAIGKGILSNVEFSAETLLLSGRCGWDIVAKASRAGVGTVVCIGACSSLAADTARSLGMRIYSFMKSASNVGIGPIAPTEYNNP
ncbi:MAG: hypothetical protein GWP25_06295 [Euryarchaeota archaeon]|nr:hypothetical protein [Euryarchaeota archaeon]